jgi:hypothetical protein
VEVALDAAHSQVGNSSSFPEASFMNTFSLCVASVAALVSYTLAEADFSVTSQSTMALQSTVDHVSYVKQWTLTATATNEGDDKIDSLNLDISGRVFVSYESDMPSGVLGYVNVSGDSKEIVDMVKVVTNDDDDEQLHVRIDNSSASSGASGYLLTEIFLAASNGVTDVKSQRTAEVVLENDVLVTRDSDEELQLEASDSSAVFVAATGTSLSLKQLKLELSDSSSLQFAVGSVSISEDAKLEAHDSSAITVLSSSFEADKLELDAEDSGTICIAAGDVSASSYDGEEASKISMPNASNKYDSTGGFACDESSAPTREPKCTSSSCPEDAATSTTSSATGSSTIVGISGSGSSATTAAPADSVSEGSASSSSSGATSQYSSVAAEISLLGLILAVSVL